MHGVIEGPANWRGPDMLKRTDWIHEFSPAEIREIEDAITTAKARGKTLDTLTVEDFPLPTVAKVLDHGRDLIENGPGLFHLRGIKTDGHSKDDLRLLYWGLGKHLGTAVSQSSRGDFLGDVKDLGLPTDSPKGRGYTSNSRLSFHTDTCDVVGLFVLRVAKEGGVSRIGSSLAVHNEVARTRPDLLEVLYQPFWWSWQGQEPPGQKPYYPQPIYTYHKGKFSCRYVRGHIKNGQLFPEVPRLTDAQVEALDYIDELANDPAFHYDTLFQPGDLQLLSNHTCYHSRTAFTDWPEEDRKRHLLRMWLSVPNSRELSPLLGTIYRDQRAGAVRGGFPSRTGRRVYETAGAMQD
jgi:hypothetical protein